MDWDRGYILRGQDVYVIESKLDGGSSGIIYLATKGSLDTKVVIKRLNPELLNRPDWTEEEKEKCKQRFYEEGQNLASCKHPNIVEVIETFFTEDSIPVIVMKYIHGKNLFKVVENQRILIEKQALNYIRQIGDALIYIHNQQPKRLLHRDISPKNILIEDSSQKAILIDFGIAREYIPNRLHTSYHTDGFAPYEQYLQQYLQDNPQNDSELLELGEGAYTDIYALAATLYYLLVGQTPVSPSVRIHFHNLSLSPSPKERNANISERVNDAIVKGMQFYPTERPQSVQEWLEMLPPENEIEFPPLQMFDFQVVFLYATGQERSVETHPAELFEQVLSEQPLLKLEMVKIPAGSFWMGSPSLEDVEMELQDDKSNERPQHQVRVGSFFMGRFPITQAMWKFVANLPPVKINLIPDCSHFKNNETYPVEQVSWCEAIEFCERLAQFTKLQYRLPTEAEWEYACRAGIENKPFHFGDTITTKFSNYDGREFYKYEPTGEFHGKTKPVGSFPVSNRFGLSDMHGNVWEWCADAKHDNYNGAPEDARSWEIEGESNNRIYRVVRGGSWKTHAQECRSPNRKFVRQSGSDSSYGFRVALSNNLNP